MKLNYLSHLKMAVLSNLKELRTRMLSVGLNLGVWLLMKLLLLEIGNGYGRKSYVLRLLIMKLLYCLSQRLKDTTISLSYLNRDRIQRNPVVTKAGSLRVMTTHTSRKKK